MEIVRMLNKEDKRYIAELKDKIESLEIEITQLKASLKEGEK